MSDIHAAHAALRAAARELVTATDDLNAAIAESEECQAREREAQKTLQASLAEAEANDSQAAAETYVLALGAIDGAKAARSKADAHWQECSERWHAASRAVSDARDEFRKAGAAAAQVRPATRDDREGLAMREEKPWPPIPPCHLRVLVQQYVEQIGYVDVPATEPEAAIQAARHDGLFDACGDTWGPGDDAMDAEVYCVINDAGDTVWER